MAVAARSGLLVIDKPSGPTSHDVVAQVRRSLHMREVGHAGTLDPMASGVLLVMLGECTKLSRFLALESKSYRAWIRLGVGTDTDDAEGKVRSECVLPEALRAELAVLEKGAGEALAIQAALERERMRTLQRPPSFSAIKQQGMRAYVRARRGQVVELPDREVHVEQLRVLGASADRGELELELSVSKGYYVRSLARDLGVSLGVPSHLSGLRRTRVASYTLGQAVRLEQVASELGLMLSLADVARGAMPTVVLTDQGVRRALWGQAMSEADFDSPPSDQTSAWLDRAGELVAVGDRSAGRPTVVRAFSRPEVVC